MVLDKAWFKDGFEKCAKIKPIRTKSFKRDSSKPGIKVRELGSKVGTKFGQSNNGTKYAPLGKSSEHV